MLTPSPLRGPLVELTRQSLPCCTLVAMVLRAWVDDEPALTVGRWHVVQRWRGLDVGADPGPDDERGDGDRHASPDLEIVMRDPC